MNRQEDRERRRKRRHRKDLASVIFGTGASCLIAVLGVTETPAPGGGMFWLIAFLLVVTATLVAEILRRVILNLNDLHSDWFEDNMKRLHRGQRMRTVDEFSSSQRDD